MAEYDAFGRKIDEMPSATTPAPMQVSAPTGPPRAPRARKGHAGLLIALTIFLGTAGGAASLIAFSAGEEEAGPATSVEVSANPAPEAPAPAETVAAEPVKAGSLIERVRFGPAVRKLRADGHGQLVFLRVAADRIDAQLKTKDGRLRNVQIKPDGKLREISISPPGFNGTPTMSFEVISSAAPERLARAAAKKLGAPLSQIDYLVAIDLAGKTTWSLFFKDGTQFLGDAAGKITRRIN